MINNHKKILFRADAGQLSLLGSGHLIRSITIAKILIKHFNVKKNNISFLVKNSGKFKLANKILSNEGFKYKIIKNHIKNYTDRELKEILKINFKIIIFDRLDKIKKNIINKLKFHGKKIVCFDDISKNKLICDLSFNPLLFKKKNYTPNNYSGYEFNILPSFFTIKKKKKIKKIKKILLSFGGYDKNNIYKKIKNIINSSEKYHFIIDKKNLKNKIKFTKNKKFFSLMNNSDLIVCSGGLTMFDSINLNIPIIAIPQYKHQYNNIKKLEKYGVLTSVLKRTNIDVELKKKIREMDNILKLNMIKKKQSRFSKINKTKFVAKKIYELYEN